MSDLRVFVTFPESTAVFAGETLQCKITFKNVSQKPGSRIGSTTINSHAQYLGERLQKAPPLQISVAGPRRSGIVSPRVPSSRPPSVGQRQSFSHTASSPKPPALPSVMTGGPNNRPNHKHKRSVSIVSLSSDVGIESGGRGNRDIGVRSPPAQARPRGHGRSASLQIAIGRHMGAMNGTMSPSAVVSGRSTQVPPTPRGEAEVMNPFSFPARMRSTPTTPISPGTIPRHAKSRSVSKAPGSAPALAAAPGSLSLEKKPLGQIQSLTVETGDSSQPNKRISQIDIRSFIDEPEYEQIPSARLTPAYSVSGETPRSSGEFYSMSNSTTETLLSEYDQKASSGLIRPVHNRRHSLLSIGPKHSESLMMGYAQITGSFTLDGSLVQTSVFEEVKRKGVVGTQSGGGVVGIEAGKADGGFLSGFGWGLGGGLGGLLSGGGMSSIAEMKNVASMKSIPILSTPQSILFVDLQLAPGESRSYMYKFTLPRGIPPSHRGKAIKIVYNLVLGTQRPGKGVVQPTVIEIPFRVFPNVNGNGSLPAHDLMSPVVLLRDEAITSCLDEPREATLPEKHTSKQESSLEDFLSYVDSLLVPQETGYNAAGSLGLLSPSFAPNSKQLSIYDEQPTTCKDVVEMAILGGNSGPRSGHCSIFEIARNGHRVAAITMSRPAYKLGESIMAIVDFTNAEISCYHIHATLESSEKVDPALALRSPSSIYRATRRVYAQHSESTLFANRILFTPTIPSSASPEFATSGICNSWVLRFEFITPAGSSRGQFESEGLSDDLLEQTYVDDRGELYEPRQGISVESFDASIPVKIYPNGADLGTVGGIVGVQTGTAASIGFVV